MSQFFIKNFYKQRADFAKEAEVRDKKLSFPEGIIEQRDIRYLDDQIEAHRLDISELFRSLRQERLACSRELSIDQLIHTLRSFEFDHFPTIGYKPLI